MPSAQQIWTISAMLSGSTWILSGCAPDYAVEVKSWEQLRDQAYRAKLSGNYAKSEELYDAAVAKARTLNDTVERLAGTLIEEADLFMSEGKTDRAEKLYTEALSVYETSGGSLQQATMKQTVKFIEKGKIELTLANIARDHRIPARAEQMYKQALKSAGMVGPVGGTAITARILKEYRKLLVAQGRTADIAEIDRDLMVDDDMFEGFSDARRQTVRQQAIQRSRKREMDIPER